MYIHIGERLIISDRHVIGIFNAETLRMSEDNIWITSHIDEGDKSVAVDENNRLTASKVSPFTVIKRTSLKNDFIWRKDNEQLQR